MPARRNKGGRPPKWRDDFIDQARQLASVGMTDVEIANFFDVNVSTIYHWKVNKPGFSEAFSDGGEEADERVKRSMFQRAVGYERKAVKIFMPAGADEPVYAEYLEHVPPDVSAGKFWLGVRQGWAEKSETKAEVNVTGDIDAARDAVESRLARLKSDD